MFFSKFCVEITLSTTEVKKKKKGYNINARLVETHIDELAKSLEQSDGGVETERGKPERKKAEHIRAPALFFLLQAPLQDRQISFGASSRCIWRLLCLSLSLCLPPSLFHTLPLSPSRSPDCSD